MGSATRELEEFVRDALPKASRSRIEAALLGAGWPREQVASALAAYADTDFPVAVPKPRVSLSSQEAFAYLVMFSTLYFAAYHFCSLLFDFINLAFPDAIERGARSGELDGARWSVSSLAIAFPVFLFTSYRVNRELARNAAKRLSPVRRWLTYLTLFVAAVILIVDTTTLVYNVLGGELTVRFALKAAVVAAVAGSLFAYYLWDLRSADAAPGKFGARRIVAAALAAAVALTVAGAVLVLDPPELQRQRRLDERRTEHLQRLEREVKLYYGQNKKLPADLGVIMKAPGFGAPLADPAGAGPYGYVRLDERKYQLCANYAMETNETGYQGMDEWKHGKGKHCFTLDAAERN